MSAFEAYKDFSAVLKQKTGVLHQNMSGDTLFGKFAWSILELYGEESLRSILDRHRIEPVIIFSGLFPKGWIPAPVFSQYLERSVSLDDYRIMKEAKKLRFIPIKDLEGFVNGSSSIKLKEIVDRAKGLIYADETMHVSISRLDGTALEGKLFSQTEYWFKDEVWVFVRVSEDFLKEIDLNKILTYMFETGVGAKKSTGKGCFELVSISETDLLAPGSSVNAFLSLSRWVPNEDDPSNGYYRIYSKNPRLGGTLAASGIFQKKPILLIDDGSWFYADFYRPWFGRVIEKIQLNESAVEDNVIQSTYCLPLYFRADRVGVYDD